jgi:transglutaminase-like putative cysteine protease
MRTSRWWDVPAVLLLAAALVTAAARLVATEWVDYLGLAQTLVLLGWAAGLALGQSRFSPAVAALFGLLYALFVVPWQLGISIGRLSGEALWSDRLVVLANRLIQAFHTFAQQESVQDPVLFLFAVAVLAWGLSVHAGYALTRRASPWRIVVPPGVAILLIQTSDRYRPRGIWYLAVYFLFSLLLVARLTLLRLQRRWHQDDARTPPLVGLDLSYATVVVVVVAVLLSWTIPAMADVLPSARQIWDRATSPWEERIDRLFASLRRRGGTITAANYYGGEFALGQGRELSDDLVVSVQVPAEPTDLRYYWRARIYDDYADGRWNTEALTLTGRIEPGAPVLSFPELEGRRSLTFTFTSPQPLMTLYAASQPRMLNHPVEVTFAENADGTADVAALRATPSLGAGESYTASSSIADVTIAQLRDAGTDYPQWVTERYLQIPDTITPRTRRVAELIAEGQETPYDVAAAVTQYLRETIQYSETITDTPPSGQEPLDWFLFEGRVGFCNWYASSEVVLLRSLDIPARLAVGFAEGERQRGTNTNLVYERNAHAWPEVYFPGVGWVEFEPTVSEEPIIRPSGAGETDDEGRTRAPREDEPYGRWRERLDELEGLDELSPGNGVPVATRSLWERIRALWLPFLILLGGVLLVLAWRARRRRALPPLPVLLEASVRRIGWTPPAFLRRWAHLARLSPLERAYSEVGRALVRLGASPALADTPAERAAALVDLLPLASEQAYSLLAEYQAATYSPHRYNAYLAQEAARTIRRLSWRARLQRFVGSR